MPTTISICPKCHGAVVATSSSYVGKRCTCPRGPSEAASTATAMLSSGDSGTGTLPGAAVAKKLCCKCGADVTHERRMKDHLGRYWCYECGAADQAKKGQRVSMICPDCHRHVPPTHMIKLGEEYVCEACHAKRKTRRGLLGLGKKGADANSSSSSSGIVVAILLIAALAAAAGMYAYAMDMFP